MTLVDRLHEHATVRPQATFLVTADLTLTWGETVDRVERLASELEDRGVRPGEHVALTCANSPLFVIAWFATIWVGAVSVPMHTRMPTESTVDVLADASAVLHVTDRALPAQVEAAAPTLQIASMSDLDDLIRGRRAHPGVRQPGHAPASLLYTSGTTGAPKGAVVPGEAQLRASELLSEAIGLRPDDRMALALPLYHTNPQIYGVMTATCTGSSIAILPAFRAAAFFEDAIGLGATCFSYVGTILHELAARPGPPDDHPLRFCVGGGAPSDVWTTVEDQFGIRVSELYGMTETAGWVTCNTVTDSRRASCGRARDDVEVAIVDSEGRLQAPGCKGEIVLRPREPNVLFDGYHRRPDVTVARTRNLWFHTGDLGWLDADGYLFFGGRSDDMIRRGGENVDPDAVESVLASLPGVEEVAVVGVPHESLGAEVKAVLTPAVDLDVPALLTLCERALPSFAWPRYVELRDALPKTATEKLARHELRRVLPDDLDLRAAISSHLRKNRP
jgi:acyl-CoA synthetase (AMP-forming)/AMP-acid ligase II